ncbi:hypothetical protein [Mycobacterium sp. E2989]|uniref:hypothetical protein n=1 Tax=Mycobacterium sp. E2989 TaxID=1834140 RepID=UPI0007FD6B26|nr:hypothetical protein [Mycobacterium sp. E2989]OBH85036.1 hypothetical protein A5680_08115 [Mycobacterium sp. E2989]
MRHGEQVYDIEMALLRNYGYVARKVDNPDDDPLLHVLDKAGGVGMTVTVSSDGFHWVAMSSRHKPIVLPIQTPGSRIADAIVPALDAL